MKNKNSGDGVLLKLIQEMINEAQDRFITDEYILKEIGSFFKNSWEFGDMINGYDPMFAYKWSTYNTGFQAKGAQVFYVHLYMINTYLTPGLKVDKNLDAHLAIERMLKRADANAAVFSDRSSWKETSIKAINYARANDTASIEAYVTKIGASVDAGSKQTADYVTKLIKSDMTVLEIAKDMSYNSSFQNFCKIHAEKALVTFLASNLENIMLDKKIALRDFKREWVEENKDESKNWIMVHVLNAYGGEDRIIADSVIKNLVGFLFDSENTPYIRHELAGIPIPRESKLAFDSLSTSRGSVSVILDGHITGIYTSDISSTSFHSSKESRGGWRGEKHGFVRHPLDNGGLEDFDIDRIRKYNLTGDELVSERSRFLKDPSYNNASGYYEGFIANSSVIGIIVDKDTFKKDINNMLLNARDTKHLHQISKLMTTLFSFMEDRDIGMYTKRLNNNFDIQNSTRDACKEYTLALIKQAMIQL